MNEPSTTLIINPPDPEESKARSERDAKIRNMPRAKLAESLRSQNAGGCIDVAVLVEALARIIEGNGCMAPAEQAAAQLAAIERNAERLRKSAS